MQSGRISSKKIPQRSVGAAVGLWTRILRVLKYFRLRPFYVYNLARRLLIGAQTVTR